MTNNRISTRKETSERRSKMLVRVIDFDIKNNHLSHTKKDYFNTVFKEAKFYYNSVLDWANFTIVDDFGNLVYPHKLKDFDTKNDVISVFNSLEGTYFLYHLQYLSSQMKQKIIEKLTDNVKSLSAKKKKGQKTGTLKFKSQVNVPLKQYNNSFFLDDDCKYLNIQGFKGNFKLAKNRAFSLLAKELGFSNLSLNNLIDSNIIEIANAEIIKSGCKHHIKYQFKLTVYINPEIHGNNNMPCIISNKKPRFNKNRILNKSIKNSDEKPGYLVVKTKDLVNLNSNEVNYIKQFRMNFSEEQQELISCTSVGIDAGISSEFTLNFGNKFYSIKLNSRDNIYLNKTLEEIKLTQTQMNIFINRSKKLNKKASNKFNKSRRYYDIKNKLNTLWTKYENIKVNMVNHLISYLKTFNKVYFQNEMISRWHGDKLKGYGKKIQAGILGKVYAKLKKLNERDPEKYIMLSKYEKTTKTCGNIKCKKVNQITLGERVYNCPGCGYKNDRDSHSAYNMIKMGCELSAIKMDYKKTENKFSNKIDEMKGFGRNSERKNLVKNVTSFYQAHYLAVIDKLCSQSYINANLNSFV